jgi:maltose/moltooligosaccharide transporter
MAGSEGARPHLSLLRILEMNLGFFGLQFSFGLQQGNMGPIYSYLGADEASLPLLQLAGPLTGLLVQPLIGAMSDRTDSRFGRRTPYFLLGAVICTVGLALMPYSGALWVAASLLWLLDAGNNVTMEPYRAYVSDRLGPAQLPIGFLTQGAFTGLAQCLAFLMPAVLVRAGMDPDRVDAHNVPLTVHAVFAMGAVLSLATILWSVWRVPELPLTPAERAAIAARPKRLGATLAEIGEAIRAMPLPMRKLAWMSLFQWSAMACYWTYVTYSIGRTVFGTSQANTPAFHQAVIANGVMAAAYNGIGFVAAFAMVPLAKRLGAGVVHAGCLLAMGTAMLAIPHIAEQRLLLWPAIGLGVGWASIMGNPYVILAGSIPPERTGVYMGIFNMMIVVPIMTAYLGLRFLYRPLLGGVPGNALTLAGLLMGCAALAVLTVREGRGPAQGS